MNNCIAMIVNMFFLFHHLKEKAKAVKGRRGAKIARLGMLESCHCKERGGWGEMPNLSHSLEKVLKCLKQCCLNPSP